MGVLKIDGVPVAATEFAWDGCHKIYLIFTPEDRAKMVGYGYGQDDSKSEILPVSELPEVWNDTCSLRFISSADFKHHYVDQFEEVEPAITYEEDE